MRISTFGKNWFDLIFFFKFFLSLLKVVITPTKIFKGSCRWWILLLLQFDGFFVQIRSIQSFSILALQTTFATRGFINQHQMNAILLCFFHIFMQIFSLHSTMMLFWEWLYHILLSRINKDAILETWKKYNYFHSYCSGEKILLSNYEMVRGPREYLDISLSNDFFKSINFWATTLQN